MSIYRCSSCGCIENTALSYWFEQRKSKKYLCSECDPKIGKWHGIFEKKSAEGYYFDANGFIYSPEDVDVERMEWKHNRDFKMIGVVSNDLRDGKLKSGDEK